MNVYLDNAATTPMLPEVVDAMLPFMRDHFGNPSSTHAFGRKTKTSIEQARRRIATHMGVAPKTICFTSGGTEADNMALHAAVEQLGCQRILTCATEHKAVLATAELMAAKEGISMDLIPLLDNGKVDLKVLEDWLSDGVPTLVSVMHGNNEVGVLQDIEAIGQCCRRHGALFHTDTVQTMGHYRMNLGDLPIDFAACSAHKLHGPKGTGFLYVRDGLRIGAHITGGSQERAMRGGTENLIGIMGLAKALDLAFHDLKDHEVHIRGLKAQLVSGIQASVPGVRFNVDSDEEDALYTVLSVNFPAHPKNGMLLFLLDLEGVACSGGSACSSGSAQPSHVLSGLGLHDPERMSIRFSFSRLTTPACIDHAIEAVRAIRKEEVQA
ncbi:MAG: cysteine desulfurase [Crocinitomicaceae bacterium TMED114]|nr:MAG: cysteine desulfurase [Crocinitomicaceae bacterium TMED114]